MVNACEKCASMEVLVKKPNNGVNVVQRRRNLGLLIASYVGHIKCMKILISEGAGANVADEKFVFSLLRKLCRKMGYPQSLNVKIPHDQLIRFTPLICAAVNGHLECVEILVKKGADVNLVSDGRTALGAAAENGQHKCLKHLIELGANVNHTDATIRPALMCVSFGHNKNTLNLKRCIEVLAKAGADVNTGYTFTGEIIRPLIDAVELGTPENLSVLIKAGADINLGNGNSFPLYSATFSGKFKVEKILIDAGADVNKRNHCGETPLNASLISFSQGCFNLMMKQGADVNTASNKEVTSVMRAATSCGHFQVMHHYLMDDEYILAEKIRSVRLIGRLLKAGAEINRIDPLGRNSLQFSIEGNQKNVKEIHMLYAAGETLDGPTVPVEDKRNGGVIHINIPEYFTELKENLNLKHLCREAIRKHLIDLDPHEHLFGRIPQLGLPSIVTEYLLFDCSLNYRRAAECKNNI